MRIRLVSSQLTFMPLFKIYTTISIIVLVKIKTNNSSHYMPIVN